MWFGIDSSSYAYPDDLAPLPPSLHAYMLGVEDGLYANTVAKLLAVAKF
jgi:hypothetical protein